MGPDLEPGMQHVELTNLAQGAATTDVPGHETTPRPAQHTIGGIAGTADARPIQGQQPAHGNAAIVNETPFLGQPATGGNADAPDPATAVDTRQAANVRTKLVPGLNLKRDVTEQVQRLIFTKSTPDEYVGSQEIENLHRYNILWAQSRLLQHFHQPEHVDLVDVSVAEKISQDLHKYSNALRDYRFYRTEGRALFATGLETKYIAREYVSLEEKRSRLRQPHPELEEAEAADLAESINDQCKSIGSLLLRRMADTTSGITEEEHQKEKVDFSNRLLAAVGGGIALIAPMLIMVLAPPARATALATTCCFVLVVAIALARFMDDSQPKDIVACTAAYTAVLVVFVGVGGGT